MCVCVCDLDNSSKRRPGHDLGSSATKEEEEQEDYKMHPAFTWEHKKERDESNDTTEIGR